MFFSQKEGRVYWQQILNQDLQNSHFCFCRQVPLCPCPPFSDTASIIIFAIKVYWSFNSPFSHLQNSTQKKYNMSKSARQSAHIFLLEKILNLVWSVYLAALRGTDKIITKIFRQLKYHRGLAIHMTIIFVGNYRNGPH